MTREYESVQLRWREKALERERERERDRQTVEGSRCKNRIGTNTIKCRKQMKITQ